MCHTAYIFKLTPEPQVPNWKLQNLPLKLELVDIARGVVVVEVVGDRGAVRRRDRDPRRVPINDRRAEHPVPHLGLRKPAAVVGLRAADVDHLAVSRPCHVFVALQGRQGLPKSSAACYQLLGILLLSPAEDLGQPAVK